MSRFVRPRLAVALLVVLAGCRAAPPPAAAPAVEVAAAGPTPAPAAEVAPTADPLPIAAPADAPAPRERPYETPRVVFMAPEGEQTVIVEVADSPDTLERGLMFRESLPEGTGMIFVFPDRRDRTFWMKNTLIALDMIFVDGEPGAAEASVVGVVAQAEPQTLVSRRCGRPSRWVVEVPGGYAARHGIGPGVRMRFVDMP